MTDPDPEDPLVAAYVEAALAPCIGRMPPEAIEAVRVRLFLFYETHPEAVALLDEIREAQEPAPTVTRSGDQVRRDPTTLEEAGGHPVAAVERSRR